MNRQIKFRGKRKDTGEWVYGDLLHIDGGCLIYFGSQTETETPYIENSSPIAVELFKTEIAVVEPETVGQFTGLCDKNGKEIYEGDIVDMKSITPRHWVVKFSWGTFYLAGIESKLPCRKCFSQYEYEICYEYSFIGNIHDNPELMKGGEE